MYKKSNNTGKGKKANLASEMGDIWHEATPIRNPRNDTSGERKHGTREKGFYYYYYYCCRCLGGKGTPLVLSLTRFV